MTDRCLILPVGSKNIFDGRQLEKKGIVGVNLNEMLPNYSSQVGSSTVCRSYTNKLCSNSLIGQDYFTVTFRLGAGRPRVL